MARICAAWDACEFLNIPVEMRKHLSSGSHVTYPAVGLTRSMSISLCCRLKAASCIIQLSDPAELLNPNISNPAERHMTKATPNTPLYVPTGQGPCYTDHCKG